MDEIGFVEAAQQAIWTWRFAPATCDGRPVSSVMIVPVRFSTNGPARRTSLY